MLKYLLKTILLSVSLVFLSSCSSSLKLISEDVYLLNPDKFDSPNTKNYAGSTVDIKPNTFGGIGFSFFRLRFTQLENIEAWQIRTIYSSEKWLFVEKVKILVDKDIYEFNSMSNPIREVGYPLGGSDVYENNLFIINSKICKAILSANEMSIRLIGQNFYIDRDLSKDDIHKLKNFIAYIDTKVSRTKLN